MLGVRSIDRSLRYMRHSSCCLAHVVLWQHLFHFKKPRASFVGNNPNLSPLIWGIGWYLARVYIVLTPQLYIN